MSTPEILAHLAAMGTPPDSASALSMSVGLSATVNRLTSDTFPFLQAGGSEIQFVFGPYGRGKSHFLRTVEEVAWTQGLVTAYVDCKSGQSPFLSIRDTYSMIARALRAPQAVRTDDDSVGVAAMIGARLDEQESGTSWAILKQVQRNAHIAPDYRNLAYAFGSSLMNPRFGGLLQDQLEALLAATPTYSVTLGQLYRAHPELPRPIGKLGRRNAGSWLRSLISLPWALGYRGLVILFDETERTHSLSRLGSRAQQEHLANLRNFVDYVAVGAFRGCAVYYAVVEDFIQVAQQQLQALSQRIERVRFAGANYRNPLAIWASLDELTEPGPSETQFFVHLAERILALGRDAGLPAGRVDAIMSGLRMRAGEYADAIYEGAVREFVKLAASQVAQEVARHG